MIVEEKITSSVVIKKFKSMEKNSKWSIIEFDFFTGIYDHSVIDASDEFRVNKHLWNQCWLTIRVS